MRRNVLVLLYVVLGTSVSSISVNGDDWPQWRGIHRDGTWSEAGAFATFPSPELERKWTAKVGSGYSGPTVANGRVYLTDRVLDPERERVLCFDAETGESIWERAYPAEYKRIGYTAGPRASVGVHEGLAYALGTMGHIHCLRAKTGDVVWKRDLNADYDIQMPNWGIAASPLIYHDMVILHIGGKEACVVALDRRTGREIWTALGGDQASYSAPIVIRQAGQDVVVCWNGDSVAGLEPGTGRVHWRIPFPPSRMPIGVATPIWRNNRIFVTSFYDGAMMVQLGENELTASTLWHKQGANERHTDGLQSIISTPIWLGDHIYGVDSYGELRCLKAETGDRIWEDLTATPKARWSTIHFVQNDERIWMFNERGELIISKLSPAGFQEISRAKLIEPTTKQLPQRNGVCWSHPAFANRHVFARNDRELVCASLATD